MSTSETQLIADLSHRLASVGAPGAAAALVSEGETAWVGMHGTRRAESNDPVTTDTAFWWFSMTKIATATAIMQLAELGAVALDSPAREYLDRTPIDARITIRQLLNHSSGLANPMPMRWIHPADAPGPDQQAMVAGLLERHQRLRSEPGTRSSYTNLGFLVLGEIIAAAGGKPYPDYVVEKILRPIGATRTGFGYPPEPATGHHPRRDPLLPLARLALPRWVLGPAAGSWRTFTPFLLDGSAYGGLVGPVDDAAKLLALHLGDGSAVLGPRAIAEMQQINTRGKRFDLGLGWFRPHAASERGETFVEHLGGGAGFGTVMRVYPERRIGIVAMANVSSNKFDHEALVSL